MTLYEVPETRLLAVGPGGASHVADELGRPLCGVQGAVQETLDAGPSCGWCRLILAGDYCCGRPMLRRRTFDGLSFVPDGRANWEWWHCPTCRRWERIG